DRSKRQLPEFRSVEGEWEALKIDGNINRQRSQAHAPLNVFCLLVHSCIEVGGSRALLGKRRASQQRYVRGRTLGGDGGERGLLLGVSGQIEAKSNHLELGRPLKRLDQAGKQPAAVGAAH